MCKAADFPRARRPAVAARVPPRLCRRRRLRRCAAQDHSPTRVEAAARKSLAALRLEYLDLYLIHWPVTGNRGPSLVPSLTETWAAMQVRLLINSPALR